MPKRVRCSPRFTPGLRRGLRRRIFRKRRHRYRRWKSEKRRSQPRARCKMNQGNGPAHEPSQNRRESRGNEIIASHPAPLAEVFSVRGRRIRLTLRQWVHIIENHDYMAGNRELVLETIIDPDELVQGEAGETLALRAYPRTNLTAKTAVVAYRDEPEGFVITAWLTSRPDWVQARGVRVWSRLPSTGS